MNFQQPSYQPQQAPADRLNLTDRDLSSHLGPVPGAGREGLNIQFFYVRVRVESQDPITNGTYQTRLCVAKNPKGDRLTVATRFITEDRAALEFPREFAMFKQHEDVPTAGTPLYELPGVTQSMIGLLTIYNLRCIEDVAACADEHIGQMGADGRAAKKLAQRWMALRDQSADLIDNAKLDAARDAEIQRLQADKEASDRRLIELEAQVRALSQMQGVAVPAAATGQPIMVDRADDVADAAPDNGRMFEGGLVSGNDDLEGAPSQADPLGIGSRKRG